MKEVFPPTNAGVPTQKAELGDRICGNSHNRIRSLICKSSHKMTPIDRNRMSSHKSFD
ncbi:hypothetical protein LEP1GSC068_4092 [Leptospira sp. Fiocruz LV3954]|nr:hypothetical protein LEP1GSC068_4092 [Leptospira sp. Fiocruz LV3954]EMI69778.1 hypothetical protein LEP1GSC076_3359 [Leptospira sp. Fiocruz LV4135]